MRASIAVFPLRVDGTSCKGMPGQHRRGGGLPGPATGRAFPASCAPTGRRMAEAKGFIWQDFRDLVIAAITTCQPRSLVLQ